MKTYTVYVWETRSRVVKIKANYPDQARKIADRKLREGEIKLTKNDRYDVRYEVEEDD